MNSREFEKKKFNKNWNLGHVQYPMGSMYGIFALSIRRENRLYEGTGSEYTILW